MVWSHFSDESSSLFLASRLLFAPLARRRKRIGRGDPLRRVYGNEAIVSTLNLENCLPADPKEETDA